MMIQATPPTFATGPLAKDIPQASAKPAVDVVEHSAVAAVLEVGEPAAKRLVDFPNHKLQAVTRVARCLRPQRVFELRPAFIPRPMFSAAKRVAQKVEALGSR